MFGRACDLLVHLSGVTSQCHFTMENADDTVSDHYYCRQPKCHAKPYTHGPFMAVAHGSLLFSHQVAPAGSAIWGPKGTGRSCTMGLQRDKPTIFMVEQHFHNCNSYLFILAVPSQ